MKSNFFVVCFALGLSVLLTSCGKDHREPANSGVSLKPISFAQWDDTIKNYRSNVVVVDLWATWCLPCVKRFPKMVEMSHKFADRNVRFVSINFDDPADAEALPKVNQFLQDMQADFDNYYFKENLIDAFDYMKIIGLPTVLVFDADGNEARRLTGVNPNNQFTDKDIEAAVNKLLTGG